jgi:hypothetical protein
MRAAALGYLAVVLAVGGCARQAPTPPPEPEPTPPPRSSAWLDAPPEDAPLIPLVEGNRWLYDGEYVLTSDAGQTSTEGKMDILWEVTAVRGITGGRMPGIDADITMSRDGEVVDKQVWRLTGNGLFQMSGGLDAPVKFDPPSLMMPVPPNAGERLTYQGTGLTLAGLPGTIEAEGFVKEPQRTETPLAPISATAVESRGEFVAAGKRGTAITEAWFRPGLGVVRYRSELIFEGQNVQTTLRLKSTNVNP